MLQGVGPEPCSCCRTSAAGSWLHHKTSHLVGKAIIMGKAIKPQAHLQQQLPPRAAPRRSAWFTVSASLPVVMSLQTAWIQCVKNK